LCKIRTRGSELQIRLSPLGHVALKLFRSAIAAWRDQHWEPSRGALALREHAEIDDDRREEEIRDRHRVANQEIALAIRLVSMLSSCSILAAPCRLSCGPARRLRPSETRTEHVTADHCVVGVAVEQVDPLPICAREAARYARIGVPSNVSSI
jgi:hypothetical protein